MASDDLWAIEQTTGSAAAFHRAPLEREITRPTLWFHQVQQPALVLGSTQPETVIDHQGASNAGWEVCRRRSGGGVVAVVPNQGLWVDVFIPRDHSLHHDDIGLAFAWLGDAWVAALAHSATGCDPVAHSGPLLNRAAGRLLCFAGLGPGEVTVGGPLNVRYKVVGLSQRRTRAGSRFQCLALLQHDADPLFRFGSPELAAIAASNSPMAWPKDSEPPEIGRLRAAFITAAGAAADRAAIDSRPT
jgi:lipoate---protein ligase